MSKHRVRTHNGHRLWLSRLQAYVPGEVEEMDLTEKHCKLLTEDPRVLVDGQIDAFLEALAMPKPKPRGNTGAPIRETKVKNAASKPDEPAEPKKRRTRTKRSEL